MSFELFDSDSHGLQEIFGQIAPSFFGSTEYLELDEESRAVDGLLIAALTRYTERMIAQENSRELDACIALIERLASSNDLEVVNYVYTEVFDNLNGPEEDIQQLVLRFGPKTREAYDDWIRRQEEYGDWKRRQSPD